MKSYIIVEMLLGKYDIDGNNLFVLIFNDSIDYLENCCVEYYVKYLDI